MFVVEDIFFYFQLCLLHKLKKLLEIIFCNFLFCQKIDKMPKLDKSLETFFVNTELTKIITKMNIMSYLLWPHKTLWPTFPLHKAQYYQRLLCLLHSLSQGDEGELETKLKNHNVNALLMQSVAAILVTMHMVKY